jgi:Fe-S oxidoreductase
MVVAAFGIKDPKRSILALYARPKTSNLALKIGRRLQKPIARDSRLLRTRAVPVLRSQTRWRSLPVLASRPLRTRYAGGAEFAPLEPVVPNEIAGRRVALFPGCMTDNLYPEQGAAIVRSLRGLGATVVFPAGLHCCGLPALNSGDVRHGSWMAKQTLRALEQIDTEFIVSGSASCVATISQDYLHLFRDDPGWLARAEAVAAKVVDFTTFVDEVGALAVDMAEAHVCCGFGGSFSFDYPVISERLMTSKLDDIAATGAMEVVTDNQGCIMQLRGGSDAQGRGFTVRHLAELVAEGIDAVRRRGREADRDGAGAL